MCVCVCVHVCQKPAEIFPLLVHVHSTLAKQEFQKELYCHGNYHGMHLVILCIFKEKSMNSYMDIKQSANQTINPHKTYMYMYLRR